MKKTFTINKSLVTIASAIMLVVIGSSAIKSKESLNHNSGKSVATLTVCTNCHGKSAATAGATVKGSISIAGIPDTAIAGTAYPVSIIIKDPVAKCYGFVSIGGSGKFTTTNSGTAVSATGKAVYHGTTPIVATPNSVDSNYSITGITWTAPTTAGAVKITLAGLAGNNNGSSSGDHVYSSSFTTTVAIPTPVKLASFSANANSGKVNLVWVSTLETNVSSFGIERSVDGINYANVGNVSATGTTTSSRSYSFVDDASKLSGTIYYRLKTLDKDGKVSYSVVQQVNIKATKNIITKLYPNPLISGQAIKLAYTSLKSGTVSVQVLNSMGKKVLSANLAVIEGSNTLSVSGSHLVAGIYYVSVYADNNLVDRLPVVVR